MDQGTKCICWAAAKTLELFELDIPGEIYYEEAQKVHGSQGQEIQLGLGIETLSGAGAGVILSTFFSSGPWGSWFLQMDSSELIIPLLNRNWYSSLCSTCSRSVGSRSGLASWAQTHAIKWPHMGFNAQLWLSCNSEYFHWAHILEVKSNGMMEHGHWVEEKPRVLCFPIHM